MKLKLVALTMSILGLISTPALAAHSKKHHRKHHRHHHVVRHQEVASSQDYKAMGALPVMVSPAAMIYQHMSQNMSRSMPTPEWFNRVGIAGGINVDMLKWGSRSANFQGENYRHISINDAYINLTGNVNDWAKAFASITYGNPTGTATSGIRSTVLTVPTGDAGAPGSSYSHVYANDVLSLEQAYITLANFDSSPFFFQVGKQFQDFSRYEIHPITRSMTQVLSEALQTSAKLGFVTPAGFNGSVYAFDDMKKAINYGLSLGFEQLNDQMGYDLGVGYVYSMTAANDVAFAVGSINGSGVGTSGTYAHRVGGLALYGDVNSGPFSLGARYTTALQRFSASDLPTNFTGTTGAKPWAAGIQAGYGYEGMGRNQNVYLGYQTSRQAGLVGIPRSRWSAGLNVDAWKYTNVGVQWDHDNDYSTSNGGYSRTTNLLSARLAVKFG